MDTTASLKPIKLFSTCPQSGLAGEKSYLRQVADVARWSEDNGCEGILVYSDNSLVDPWLTSQVILESTQRLCPLVAVQPVYMHPYTVAKMVASLGHLFNRRVYLNMIAGGFKNDLAALNDTTPHDVRYARLIEYTSIIAQLLSGATVTFEGAFYRVEKLKMTPPLAQNLCPGIFISGSSEAGLDAARALHATAIKYPKPAKEYESEVPADNVDSGVRIGIITRSDEQQAWDVAERRFPEDRKGQLTHQLAMKVSDSLWHTQLSETAREVKEAKTPYWLRPFENYKSFCPYLVGSYSTVALELARYIDSGHTTFILDIPPEEEELRHIRLALERVSQLQDVSTGAAA
jgi:alkanesulfonate monooxygenase